MSKCYGYGRHSTSKQSLTERAQHDRCRNYWKVYLKPQGVEWGGFHYDKAVSAKKPFSERPSGSEVYFSAQEGDHVVTAKYDRCFRSVLDGLTHLTALEDRGVLFHSEREKIDTSTAMGRAFRAVLLIISEIEREMARERALDIQESLIAQNRPYSKGCAMGYKIIGGKGNRQYRVSDEEQELCEIMYWLHTDHGYSYDRLCRWVYKQKDHVVTRNSFSAHPNYCKWAVLAYEYNFPTEYASYTKFFKAWNDGLLDKELDTSLLAS